MRSLIMVLAIASSPHFPATTQAQTQTQTQSQLQTQSQTQVGKSASAKRRTMEVLFIGNSYTARHNLASIVKRFAEAADPQLDFKPTQVIYGGRTLKDHWRLGSQHIVSRDRTTAAEVKETIDQLEAAAKDPKDKYAPAGLKRMRGVLKEIETGSFERGKWDLVVFQSYRDDLQGDESLYMQYAPRFVALAKEQGAKSLLYETTPTTQNQFPMAQYSDSTPVIKKAESIAKLAKTTESLVAPMSFVGLQCQLADPAVTLRFVNDAHLNQEMAYLTACTIFAAIFDRSPEGLPIDSVTDIRYWQNDRKTGKDRDEKPITRHFDKQRREFFQKTAWQALQKFKQSF